MALPRWFAETWRHTGAALVGPLILVGFTGVFVLFGYNSNPDVANARLEDAPVWFDFVRSLHLWSSNALLAAGFVHVAWVWRDRRVSGPYRQSYLLGASLLGVLALEHWTGLVLRWDEAAYRLADYQRALLPVENVAGIELPLHVGLLGGIALVASLLHIGLVGGGVHARVRPAFPGGWRRLRARLVIGSGAGVAVVAVLALLWPRPTGQFDLPWPTGFFALLADASGAPWLFGSSALLAWALVAGQPWLVNRPWAARSTQALSVLVFVASFLG